MKKVVKVNTIQNTIKLVFISGNTKISDNAILKGVLFDSAKIAYAYYANAVYGIDTEDRYFDDAFKSLIDFTSFPGLISNPIAIYTVTTIMDNVIHDGCMYHIRDVNRWHTVEKIVTTPSKFFSDQGKSDNTKSEYITKPTESKYEFASATTEYEDENLKIQGQIFNMVTAYCIGEIYAALRALNISLKDVYLVNINSVIEKHDPVYLIERFDSIEEFIKSHSLFANENSKFITFYIDNTGSDYSKKICEILSPRFERVNSMYIYTKDEFSKRVYDYLVTKAL